MTTRARATTTAAAIALLALTGCAADGAPNAAPTTDTVASPADTAPASAPATATSSATSATQVEGMNCANILTAPEEILTRADAPNVVLKSQWTVEGGDYKIIPASELAFSSAGSKSEYGEFEFPIEGGIRCRIRDDRPSGDPGTTYEYVKFDPAERDRILEFLRGTGFDELTLADGTVVVMHEFQDASGELWVHNTWYLGDDWLGSGIFWPKEDGEGPSPFTGEFTDATPADFLPEGQRWPMCGTFFATFQGDDERLPIGELFTGFDSLDPNGDPAERVDDEFQVEPDTNGCHGIAWHDADAAEIDAAVAGLGDPVESSTGAEIYHDTAANEYLVVFDSGYAVTDLPLATADLIREPDLTFRSLGEK